MKGLKVCLVRRAFAVSAMLALILLDSVSSFAHGDKILERVTLQLKWRHQFQFAGYYAAIEKGFYKEAGLDVTLIEAGDGVQPVTEVIEGRADFGVGNSDLVVWRGQGHPVVVLAPIFQHSPLAFLTREDSGIKSVRDLVGRTVVLEPCATELLAYLKHEGVDLHGIKFVSHPDNLAALANREVDAITAYLPNESFPLRQMGVALEILEPKATGIDFYGDTLFTTEAQAHHSPRRTRAFLNASLKGWRYAMDHPDEIIELILNKYSQRHSREHLQFEAKAMRRLIMSDIVEFGYSSPGRWRFIAESYAELDLLSGNVELDGFIFAQEPVVHTLRFYVAIAGLIVLLLLAGAVGYRYYVMSHSLTRQVLERARIEDALRKAKERYRLLVEQAPFPITISLPATGELRFCNSRARETFGLGEHPAGMLCDRLYADLSERPELIAELERNGSIAEREILLRKADGSPFYAIMAGALVDYEGTRAFFAAFNDITQRRQIEQERRELIEQLQCALSEIRTLSGLIPICCSCKRIRNDNGYWQQVEIYLSQHTDVEFTHGYCPNCFDRYMAEIDAVPAG